MNKWQTEIETYSRDDVMTVCDILANGIGQDAESGQLYKVVIDGPFSSGKAAIVDGITAAYVDGMSSKGLPETSLYEGSESEAHGKKLTRAFNARGREITNTFYHYDLNGLPIDEPDGGAPVNGGLDFESYLCILSAVKPCLRINFQYGSKSPEQEWSRKWSIEVTDPALQTPQMAGALNNLQSFRDQIELRSAQAEQGDASLSPEME